MSIEQLIKQVEDNDPQLKTLDLTSKDVPIAQAKRLAAALKRNTFLTTLKLANTDLQSDVIHDLCEAISDNNHLRHLDLSFNKFTVQDIVILSKTIKQNQHIHTLNISDIGLTTEGAGFLLDALPENYSIIDIDIGYSLRREIEWILKRNLYRSNNPKHAFDKSLLVRTPEQSPSAELTEKIQNLRTMFIDLLALGLNAQMASLRLTLNNTTIGFIGHMQMQMRNPTNLNTINAAIITMIDQLTPAQIDDLLWLVRSQDLISVGHFVSYFMEHCQVNSYTLVNDIIRKMSIKASEFIIKKTHSEFVDTLYKTVTYSYQTGLIRKYLHQYSDDNTPIPESPKKVQTLLEEALRNAAANGDFPSIKLLICYVKNLNAPDNKGLMALDYATCFARQNNALFCVDMLRNSGAKSSGLDNATIDAAFAAKRATRAPILSQDEQELIRKKGELATIFHGIFGGLLLIKITEIKMQLVRSIKLFSESSMKNESDEHMDIIKQELLELANVLSVTDMDALLLNYSGMEDQDKVAIFLLKNYAKQLEQMVCRVFTNAVPDASPTLTSSTTRRFMEIVNNNINRRETSLVKPSNEPHQDKVDANVEPIVANPTALEPEKPTQEEQNATDEILSGFICSLM